MLLRQGSQWLEGNFQDSIAFVFEDFDIVVISSFGLKNAEIEEAGEDQE